MFFFSNVGGQETIFERAHDVAFIIVRAGLSQKEWMLGAGGIYLNSGPLHEPYHYQVNCKKGSHEVIFNLIYILFNYIHSRQHQQQE